MPEDQKPRPDSKLKTLPEERQEEIAEYATDHSSAETAKWLTEGGLQTSPSAVQRFLSWFRLRQHIERSEDSIRQLLTELAHDDPALTAERLHQIGHIFFAGLALEKQDPEAWYLAQRIALRRAQLQLENQKHTDHLRAQRETIEKGLEAARESGGLTPETIKKIEQELHLS